MHIGLNEKGVPYGSPNSKRTTIIFAVAYFGYTPSPDKPMYQHTRTIKALTTVDWQINQTAGA